MPIDNQIPLPSASQSHIPSLRRTPSTSPLDNIHISQTPNSPFIVQWNDTISRNSQRIQSTSPIAFYHTQPLPVLVAPQQVPLPHNPIPPTYTIPPHAPLPFAPFPINRHLPNPPANTNNQISYVTSSLPSTKDVPLLSGKHDWGPWHSSVRTLILNANLLGHIADEPLPGAIFDPGL